MVDKNHTHIRMSTEFKRWLDTKIEKKGESYEDILRRLTGFTPRKSAVDAS